MQQAFTFDKESVIKMIKGAAIAATGAAAIAVLEYLGQLQISNPIVASAVVFAVPTLINIVKEFIKGE